MPTIEQAPPAADDAGAVVVVVVVDVASVVVDDVVDVAAVVDALAPFVGVLESREHAVIERASRASSIERRMAKTKSRRALDSRPIARDAGAIVAGYAALSAPTGTSPSRRPPARR